MARAQRAPKGGTAGGDTANQLGLQRLTAATRNRTAGLLRASGFEDVPALTLQSTDGEIPHGRELSFAWLSGTVMTGLTSVMLMGAALYVSFEGQNTFSTAYEALQLLTQKQQDEPDGNIKMDRVRPITQTKSELEVVEASIRETESGRAIIRKQPFVRVKATLATAATALSEDVPAYDPIAMLEASAPSPAGEEVANPEIYGAEVEGEVQIKTAALPLTLVPRRAITDRAAAEFARAAVENLFGDGGAASAEGPDINAEGGAGGVLSAYADPSSNLRELGTVTDGTLSGIAENITIMPKSKQADEAGLGRSERVVSVKGGSFKDTLLKNGFDEMTYGMVMSTLKNVLDESKLPKGTRLRILMGPSRMSDTLIPHRLSIYSPDTSGEIKHKVTAALTDRGTYVLGQAPAVIAFPEEDTEEVNVNNLPTVYRSIWETARKHDIPDSITSRIVAMFAYDVDLTKKIGPGDSIELLETQKDSENHQELLYVALKLGGTTRELFRFRTDDGSVEFFDPDGQTGKRFLNRRPVQGGGRLASRFGYRVHPIFHTRKLHTGVDLAAPRGTPIYAAGDGTVEKAGWSSGYGQFTLIRHTNGYETGYGHQSKIIVKPGAHVRQGQLIGYVGSTGNSTGPHLHFEIRINGRFVDPLSVKLPRDRSLSAQYDASFKQTIAQIRDLMNRQASPVTVASLD